MQGVKLLFFYGFRHMAVKTKYIMLPHRLGTEFQITSVKPVVNINKFFATLLVLDQYT